MKMRILSIQSFAVLLLSFVFTAAVSGQDLGSSNKLFGGGSKKNAPAKTRKTPAKSSSATPKAKPKTRSVTKKPVAKKPAAVKKTPAKTGASEKNAAVIAPKNDKPTSSVTPPKTTVKEPKVIIRNDTPPVVIGNNSAANEEKYEEFIEIGNAAREERNYSAAEIAYKAANKVMPRDSRALLGLGNLYADQQRWADAEKAYRFAVALDPDYVELVVALSFILTRPVAASNLSERYAEAETLARKAIKLDAQSALAADQLGVALELSGEIGPETESAYRRSIQLEPNFAPAHAHLGRLLRKKGKTTASAAEYADAMRLADDLGTKLLVADVMQSEGKFKESVELLDQALSSDPRNPTALTMLGRAMTTQGNYIDAERYLKKSIEVSPSSFLSYSLLASLFARQGRFEAAENYLIQAMRYVTLYEKRTLATQFEAIGDGYGKAGKSAAAERAYRQAAALDPERETLAGKLARYK